MKRQGSITAISKLDEIRHLLERQAGEAGYIASSTIKRFEILRRIDVARVPYVSEVAARDTPGLSELYAEITNLRGGVINLYQALANQPAALRAFMGMSRYIREESSFDPALRELAILATGYALDVPYEIHHHLPIARRVGVPHAKLAAFPGWQESSEFTSVERAVLTYAHAVARRGTVDDATFGALRQHFGDAEIVELAVTVAWYHFVAAILGPLGIEIEDPK